MIKSCLSHRPSSASLLPLAPPIQDEPRASVLSRLPRSSHPPFRDISEDTRLDCWTRSVHIYPAAYPRSLAGSAVHNSVPPTYPQPYDGEAIGEDIRAQNLAAKRTVDFNCTDEPQLFIAAARYFINSELNENKNKGVSEQEPMTLILTHANGLHKETWEPMLAHLILSSGEKIEEIWALDCANHGDSAILNRSQLGLIYDGADYARDLLNLVLYYLPDKRFSRSTIPTVLPRIDCPNRSFCLLDMSIPSITSKPLDWRGRRLGLIGQSMGGSAVTLAATSIPELFHRVILVDPTISPLENFDVVCIKGYAPAAVVRRDKWASSSEALRKFKTNETFFGRWDPKVLIRYTQYALESTQPTTLKCNKLHEASNATEPHKRIFETYRRLLAYFEEGPHPFFNPYFILSDPSRSIIPEDVVDLHPCLRKLGLVVRIKGSGHLAVQEKPEAVAILISKNLFGLIQPSPYNLGAHRSKL